MSKRSLGIAAVVALACLGAAPRTRVVDGKAVKAGSTFRAFEVVTVSNLRFHDCRLVDTNAPCTVIAGTFVSHVACGEAVLILNVHMWLTRGGPKIASSDINACITSRGTATTRILRPAAGRPIKFVMIGPPAFPVGNKIANAEHVAAGWKPSYSISYSFEQVPAS